jgi:hypothetical protein
VWGERKVLLIMKLNNESVEGILVGGVESGGSRVLLGGGVEEGIVG